MICYVGLKGVKAFKTHEPSYKECCAALSFFFFLMFFTAFLGLRGLCRKRVQHIGTATAW